MATITATPLNILTDLAGPTCKLWLDAQQGVTLEVGGANTTGADIDTMTDLSGGGHVLASQSSGPLNPLYFADPRPAVAFPPSGTNPSSSAGRFDVTGGYTFTKSAMSLIVIAKPHRIVYGNSSAVQAIVSVTSDEQDLAIGTSGRLGICTSGALATSLATNLRACSSVCVLGYTSNGARFRMFRDKTKENIVLGSSGTTTIATIGQATGSFVGSYQGLIYEVIAYNGDLTDEMIDAVVDYAYEKYDRTDRRKACIFEGTSTMYGQKADNYLKGFDFILDDDLDDFMLFNVGSGATNVGSGTGVRTADILADASLEVSGVLTSQFDTQVVCVQAGSNDIYVDGDSAATQIAELKTLCTTYKTLRPGVKIVACTMLQRGDPGVGTTATYNTERLAYNALIRAETLGVYWDAVADFASITELAVADVQTDTTYYVGVSDNYIHMKQAGFDLCAPVLLAAIRAVAPSDVQPTDVAAGRSFFWDEPVYVDVQVLLDWEDLTPAQQEYIARAAALEFQRYKKRSRTDDSLLYQQMMQARTYAHQEDILASPVRTNMFGSSDYRQTQGRIHITRGRTVL